MIKIFFITFLLFVYSLHATEIDKKLFEGDSTKTYLKKIQKDINESKKLKTKAPKILKQEEALVKKLQSYLFV